ncbi:MAG: hypothetical protein AAFR71_12135 [Pseudomonadota bacterium]
MAKMMATIGGCLPLVKSGVKRRIPGKNTGEEIPLSQRIWARRHGSPRKECALNYQGLDLRNYGGKAIYLFDGL